MSTALLPARVFIGDSLTQGSNKSTKSWPTCMALSRPGLYCNANYGIGGDTIANAQTNFAAIRTSAGVTKYDANPSRRFHYHIGINNIAIASPASAATTFAAWKVIPDFLIADNAAVATSWTHAVLTTIAPCRNYSGMDSTKQQILLDVNDMIRAYVLAGPSWFALADVYRALESTVDPGYLKHGTGGDVDVVTPSVSGQSADFLHWNDVGHQLVSDVVDRAVCIVEGRVSTIVTMKRGLEV